MKKTFFGSLLLIFTSIGSCYLIDGIEKSNDPIDSKPNNIDETIKEDSTPSKKDDDQKGSEQADPGEEPQEEHEKKKYTLTFVFGNGQEDLVSEVYEGATIPFPSHPTREGYTFDRWDYSGTTMPSNNLTITAIWVEIKEQKYTVTFILDNGQPNISEEVNEGAPIPFPSNPTKEGYNFVGWDYLGEAMPGNNLIIRALWEKKEYTLTFVFGNGDSDQVTSLHEGDTITYPAAPTRYGYVFKGWDYSGTTMPGNNLTINAIWEVSNEKKYTLTFIFGNGQANDVRELYAGEAFEYPADPIDPTEKRIFKGWDKKNITNMPKENLTIIALWENVDPTLQVALTFVLNGGEYGWNPNSDKGKTFTLTGNPGNSLPTTSESSYLLSPKYFTKKNHTPKGWLPTIDSTNKVFPKADTTYYYQWNEDAKYNLTFDFDNGESNLISQLYEGDAITYPEDPIKEGYKFQGWDTTITTMPANDVVIKAKWLVIGKHLVTFVLGNGESNISYELVEGAKINYPSDPSRSKYAFAGWDKSISNMPDENVTINALWEYNVAPGVYAKSKITGSGDPGEPIMSYEEACSSKFSISEDGEITRINSNNVFDTNNQYMIVIPSSVKSLSNGVFSSLKNVGGIDLRGTKITHIPTEAFDNNYANGRQTSPSSKVGEQKTSAQYFFLPSTVETMENNVYGGINPVIYTYFDKDKNSVTALKKYKIDGVTFYYYNSETGKYVAA